MTTFFAEGDPVPQGSMSVFRGRAVHSNSAKLKQWRNLIHEAAKEAGLTPQLEPANVDLTFYLARPRSVKREEPTVKPDLDKLVRAVLDALTGVGYNDDAQVTRLVARKTYGSKPGVFIALGPVTAGDS